jgi:hypothetical protein
MFQIFTPIHKFFKPMTFLNIFLLIGSFLNCSNQSASTLPKQKTYNTYPKDYFASPVGHEIELTGTFGELRPNHFHAGLDIRPKQSGVVEPIFAAAEGWVSRIHVQPSGYGRIIYIDHPNGFTTAYAHLETFSPELNEYVKANQYIQERFEVNLTPAPYQFSVKRGQQIGLMGNSGASQGTHLHFEIRKTSTDEALNPLLFGFNVADDKSPKFYEIKLYHLNNENEVVSSKEIYLREKGKKKKVKKGKRWKTVYIAPNPDAPYSIQGDTLEIASDRLGLAIKTFDTHNWSGNTNGVYGITLYQDDATIYSFDTERFNLNETRYINAHIDYGEKVSGGGYFNRCYRLPGNYLSIYKNNINDGVISLYQNQYSKITVVAKDIANNLDTLEFWIHRNQQQIAAPSAKSYFKHLSYNSHEQFDWGGLQASIPAGCLYESTTINVEETAHSNALAFSPSYRVHRASTPVHQAFQLSIKPQRIVPDSLLNHVFIAFKEGDGDLSHCKSTWQGERLVADVSSFGNYFIYADTIKPTIKPVRFQQNMQTESRMSFRVSDNVNIDKYLEFRGEVDGQWILFSYDIKSKYLTHYFDERIANGEHELKLSVKDKQGNEQVFVSKFVR